MRHYIRLQYDTGGWDSAGYRFTKGLTQNLNLPTNLKLEYNGKKNQLNLKER